LEAQDFIETKKQGVSAGFIDLHALPYISIIFLLSAAPDILGRLRE
jgi:hypothetical protein